MSESLLSTIDGSYPGGWPNRQCNLGLSSRGPALLGVLINSKGENDGATQLRGFGATTVTPVDFGPDAPGWVGSGGDPAVALYLKCDFEGSTKALHPYTDPFIEVHVFTSAGLASASPGEVRQALAGIALKLAKAVVRRFPCYNQVQLADRAPVLPPG
ncbi:hypothetical protein ACFW1A_16635 [Kitasatospora sp. NPDC058965]|uniref:hypothetical protein n=1 Tax=Kitasatospora sp. NPDC058965 TaxID=3346682 RepID=UPI0036C52F1B